MKQETIEEAAYQARRDYQNEVGKDGMNECIMFDAMKIQKGFELGAQWQAERMYSKKDMEDSFVACWKANVPEGIECKLSFKEWFEQFKKKQYEKHTHNTNR